MWSLRPRPRQLSLWRFFFFQAEDGIRDLTVTGVQTCALPISRRAAAFGHANEEVRRGRTPPLLPDGSGEDAGAEDPGRILARLPEQIGIGGNGGGRERGGGGKRGEFGGGRII